MPRIAKTLLVCLLLALVPLVVSTATQSGGKQTDTDPVATDPAQATPAEQPVAATTTVAPAESTDQQPMPEAASLEDELSAAKASVGPTRRLEASADADRASNAEDSQPELSGPLLVAPNPAYLAQPIDLRQLAELAERVRPSSPPEQIAQPAMAEAAVTEESDAATPREAAPEEEAEPLAEDDQSAEEASDDSIAEAEATDAEATDAEAIDAEAESSDASPPPQPQPKKPLSPAMVELRDRVRQTLAIYRRYTLNMRENTAAELMSYCMAFGCNAQVYRDGTSGKKINGITGLCWNYPCAGHQPLTYAEGHIAARVGYGLQQHRSQLLALLALSRVSRDYPMRVDEDVRSVADLVEHEKLSCVSGVDLSLKLIGLVFYLPDDPTWKNRAGQQWSLQRIVQEELEQPIVASRSEGIRRLTGLGYALYRRRKREQPMDGQFGRAGEFLRKYQDYTFSMQNSDGTWGPRLLGSRQTSNDAAVQLDSTGQVLRWLVLSLEEDRLEEPGVVRAVEQVQRLLANHRHRNNVRSMRSAEIDSIMHALHALVVYDERLFQTRAADRPDPEEQAAR
ncbi:MAG: hypothetical protein JXB62_08985 [Pirellulales bacterium]|nr:hypothetical protein [Pirellulales bacterium]